MWLRLLQLCGKSGESLQISIIGQKIWKVETVYGDGESVRELEKEIVIAATNMSFWNEKIPCRFVC